MTESIFNRLYKTDVTKHIEKKGRFSYLSWAFAVKALREADPEATWEVKKFSDGQVPFMETRCGFFVEVAVTVQGITLSQVHPVLDNSNKAVPEPNAFQINTSIQRCLVKAIALHGLGLHIYQGEDLPTDDKPAKDTHQPKDPSKPLSTKQKNMIAMKCKAKKITSEELLKHFKRESMDDFTMQDVTNVLMWIEGKFNGYASPVKQDISELDKQELEDLFREDK
jgi:hypothetical protein